MDKYKEILKKFLTKSNVKFIAILLVVGVIILSLPDFSKSGSTSGEQESASASSQSDSTQYTKDLEERLKTIIEKIEGVGQCEVMVTLQNGTEYVFANESRINQTSTSDSSSSQISRVSKGEDKEYKILTVNDGSGGQKPIVIKENEPKVKGVLVACEGGNNDKTIYKITEALKILFEIPSNKVCVIKLKNK
jgi:stage III sporulation protein AG